MGSLHILLAEKEGRIWLNIICLKLYQFEGITWWCLSFLEFVLEYALQYVLKYVMLEFFIKKIMVFWNLRQAHLLEVGLMQIPVDHAPLSTTCHVGLHVDLSSTNFSLGL